MWIICWRRYPASILATIVSILSVVIRLTGVAIVFSNEIVIGIICFAIGIGIHYCAEFIAFSAWKRIVRKEGFEKRIKQGDFQIAAKLINGLRD